jgi:hypothetical protein
VFWNWVLKKMFRPERYEVTDNWRRLLSEEIQAIIGDY